MSAGSANGVDRQLCRELAAAGTATVYEASGKRGLIDVDLEPILPGAAIAGPARTVLAGQNDNRAVHEAVAHLVPGDVLVVTMPDPSPVALVGELLATQAKAQGAAGLVIDAAVRDVAQLRQMDLPVWARWRRARGATKQRRGERDEPITIGGALVNPGDIVVCDDDGAVVVALQELEGVVAATRARLAKEEALRAQFAAGALSYDLYGMRAEDRDSASSA